MQGVREQAQTMRDLMLRVHPEALTQSDICYMRTAFIDYFKYITSLTLLVESQLEHTA